MSDKHTKRKRSDKDVKRERKKPRIGDEPHTVQDEVSAQVIQENNEVPSQETTEKPSQVVQEPEEQSQVVREPEEPFEAVQDPPQCEIIPEELNTCEKINAIEEERVPHMEIFACINYAHAPHLMPGMIIVAPDMVRAYAMLSEKVQGATSMIEVSMLRNDILRLDKPPLCFMYKRKDESVEESTFLCEDHPSTTTLKTATLIRAPDEIQAAGKLRDVLGEKSVFTLKKVDTTRERVIDVEMYKLTLNQKSFRSFFDAEK
jgi:hypothetical protein